MSGTATSPAQLERYLRDNIPLSSAMQVAVIEVAEDGVVIGAPLAPNINHRETVFGGSASAVAILSAWALLHVRLRGAGITSRLVIQRNTMDYRLPLERGFTARSSLSRPEDWEKFRRTLARRGRARITVSSVLECEGRPAAYFSGEFVALTATSSASRGR